MSILDRELPIGTTLFFVAYVGPGRRLDLERF